MCTWPADVAGGAADGLDQRPRRAQEPLLVGVEDADQRHLGQVEALAEQVDADEDVELAHPQLAQQLHPAQGVDVGVEVADPDALVEQVVGEVLGHLLGQRRDEDPLVAPGAQRDLVDEVVDLALGRLEHDLGVDQAGRPDDLLDRRPGRCGLGQLVGTGRRRQVEGLADPVEELLPHQRAVVHRARQPEAVVDEHPLAGHVALVHRADLRHGLVRLVDDEQEVVGEVVDEAVRRGPRPTGRRCAASSSRCRCTTRPGASSRCRRSSACAAAAPRAACPGAPARRAGRPARSRCPRSPAPCAPGRRRSGWRGRRTSPPPRGPPHR